MLAAGSFIPALQWHCDWFLYLLIAGRFPFATIPHEFARIRQAGDQYSHACFDWKKQRPVIEAFVHILQNDYPDDYGFFRQCALLPTYDMQALALWAVNPAFRRYLTPLLFWRLLSYKSLRFLSKLCPPKAHAVLRKLVRM